MFIETVRSWKIIHGLMEDRFMEVATKEQKELFTSDCANRFPGGYDIRKDDMDALQTDTYLMLVFAYNNEMKLSKK